MYTSLLYPKTKSNHLLSWSAVLFLLCLTLTAYAQPEPTVFKTITQDINFDIQLEDAVLDPNPDLSNTRAEIRRDLGDDIESMQSGNLGFTIIISIMQNILGVDIPDSVEDFLSEIAGFATTISPPAEISIDIPVVAEGSAGISLDISMDYGGYIEIGSIGTAQVDIQYPLTVSVTAPEDEHFGCGDKITLATSCELGDDAVMNITPGFYKTELGPILGDLSIGMDIGAELYLGDCDLEIGDEDFCTKIFDESEPLLNVQTVDVPTIPPFIVICDDVFRDGANLFDLIECATGDFIYGDVVDLILATSGLDIDPVDLAEFSSDEVSINAPDIPSTVDIDIPEFQGTFKKVQPSDLDLTTIGKTLRVSGTVEDLAKLSLDLLSFLDYFGLPTSFSAGDGASIDLGDINLELFSDLSLAYAFTPTFTADFDLGTPMEWEVRNPALGNILVSSSNGAEQIVPNVTIGHDIIVYWPDDLNTEVTVNETFNGSGGLTTNTNLQYGNGISLNILQIALPPIIDFTLFEDVELIDTDLTNPGTIENHTIDLSDQIPSESSSFVLNPDDIAPVLTPKTTTVELDINGDGSIEAADVVDFANSFDLPLEGTGELEIVSVEPNTFDCDDIGQVLVAITAIDGNCNETTVSVDITVVDLLPPSFTAPADVTIDCVSQLDDLSFTGEVSNVYDNCDPEPDDGYWDTDDFTVCGGGTVVRSWSMKDRYGNVSPVQIQNITITTPFPISISCPADQVVNCAEYIEVDTNDVVITNTCNLGYTLVVEGPFISGTVGCDGSEYLYVFRAKDQCGNVAECEQRFFIEKEEPLVTVPPGGTVDCFSEISVSPDDATVVIDCPFDTYTLNVSQIPELNGTKGCPGTTYTYTYRVRDNCNRLVEVERVFTNADTPAPTITAPEDLTVRCLAAVYAKAENATVNVFCEDAEYEVDLSGPVISGAVDCPATTYTYTYTLTDACGRTASDEQVFTVANDGPEINCPSDLQITSCYGGDYLAVIEAWLTNVSATSSCGFPLTVTNDFNPNNLGTCYWNLYNPVNFRATDACGRTSTCTAQIIIFDNEPPIIFEPAQDQVMACGPNTQQAFQDWINNHGYALAVDDCSDEQLSWTTQPANPTLNCNGNANVTVTFCAVDPCGNTSCTTATFFGSGAGNMTVQNQNPVAENPRQTVTTTSDQLEVFQNNPNPFKQQTSIGFRLPKSALIHFKVFDATGRLIYQLDQPFAAGLHELGLDQSDLPASGLLYYTLSDGETSVTQKMILLD